MKLTESKLRSIIRETIRNRWKDPHSRRRNQKEKQHWVIVCDWSQHPDESKHWWGEQVIAEYFGTKRDAERKARMHSKEEGAPMWVEPSVEDQLQEN